MAYINGTNNADSLSGSSGETNTLEGLSGDDTMNGAGLGDLLYGGRGDDQLFGYEGNDYLYGDDGEDDIYTGTGSDTVYAGDGDDEVLAGGALGDAQSIFLEAGDDLVFAAAGADLIDGGRGQDVVRYFYSLAVQVNLRAGVGSGGYAEGDSFRFVEDVEGSNAYGDLLIGNGVSNVLEGLGGNDRIRGGVGADFLFGGADFDTLDYAGSHAGVAVSLLTGEAAGGDALGDEFSGFEAVIGSDFGDRLTGDAAANRLTGGGGSDLLTGGAGADFLLGGLGADRFVLRSTAESTAAVAGRDRIADFSVAGGDLIDLSFIDADPGTGGNQAFIYRGAGAFTGAGGEVRVQQIAGDTYVYADVNGDRTADMAIRLDGLLALTAGDFAL